MLLWDENKRRQNLLSHGVDFALLEQSFGLPMQTEEDKTYAYGEQRLRSICWYYDRAVVVVWTPAGDNARIISSWKANHCETRKYLEEFSFPRSG
ncbi:BrnT family toxin [Massilia sp. YIM B04103]|uniref:BrnT family toxin n=1 Tax=Massilia sp. YIM B04103 TaxID=2963106 RepID=UPI00210AE3A9|nr:BrnT family toxin [Massilia sp. YIM B04103]